MAERTINALEKQKVARLLRCRQTHRYFDGENWTGDPNRAKIFEDSVEVARACIEHGLTNVELVLFSSAGNAEIFATPVR